MSTHTPARELVPCPLTTVQVNDRPVSVRQALDRPAPEAAAVTVGLAVTLLHVAGPLATYPIMSHSQGGREAAAGAVAAVWG